MKMAVSFLGLAKELDESTSTKEKIALSNELSSLLEEEPAPFSMFLQQKIGNLLRRTQTFRKIMEANFYEFSNRVYVDNDGVSRMAIGISYVPFDYISGENFDYEIIVKVIDELKKRNLDLIVNDVSVNLLQIRNGEIGSLL